MSSDSTVVLSTYQYIPRFLRPIFLDRFHRSIFLDSTGNQSRLRYKKQIAGSLMDGEALHTIKAYYRNHKAVSIS